MVWITRDRTNDRCEMLGQAPRRCRGGDNDTALIEVMRDVNDPGVWHRKEISVRNLTFRVKGAVRRVLLNSMVSRFHSSGAIFCNSSRARARSQSARSSC
jgi:hypothetical protein